MRNILMKPTSVLLNLLIALYVFTTHSCMIVIWNHGCSPLFPLCVVYYSRFVGLGWGSGWEERFLIWNTSSHLLVHGSKQTHTHLQTKTQCEWHVANETIKKGCHPMDVFGFVCSPCLIKNPDRSKFHFILYPATRDFIGYSVKLRYVSSFFLFFIELKRSDNLIKFHSYLLSESTYW